MNLGYSELIPFLFRVLYLFFFFLYYIASLDNEWGEEGPHHLNTTVWNDLVELK